MTAAQLMEIPPQERADLLNEAGARTGLNPVLIEKDYWVCFLLALLFEPGGPGRDVIFKGGTSLSKGYGLIDRFSEDVDLVFDKRLFGFDGARHPELVSKAQAKTLIADLSAAVAAHVAGPFRSQMSEQAAGRLGKQGWSLEIDPKEPTTLLFAYPSSLPAEFYRAVSYVPSVVRLEAGARSDPWPAEQRTITSYAATVFPALLNDAATAAKVLSPTRTFWEKATILHAEAHRADGAGASRCSRHYYDLTRIADSPYGAAALSDAELRDRVVVHKSLYFRSGWARYDLAIPGSFRLIPGEDRLKALKKDYVAMRTMFFDEPPAFEAILRSLRALEEQINDQSRAPMH